jgi:copper transport protein
MRSRVRAAAAGLLLGILAVVTGPAGPAAAHAALLSTDPPAGTTLESAPAEVVLTFSEPVRAVVERIRAIAPDGTRADSGTPTVRGSALHVPLKSKGQRGTYVVSYRVISADSHPIAGGLVFSVGAPSANAARVSSGQPATSMAMRTGVAAARFVGYAGLILLAGPVIFLLLLWPRRLATSGPARMALAGGALLFVGTLAELALQVPYQSGGDFSAEAARQVFSSPYGWAHLVRLAALGALLVFLRDVVEGRAGRVDRTLLGLLGVLGLATWPISGHPSASRLAAVSVVADAAHLAAMATWMGGLIVLATFLLRQGSSRELRAILPTWSRWALLAVITITASGAINALIEIDSFQGLFHTLYGQLILAKIVLLAVIVVVAAQARRWVARTYSTGRPGSSAIVDEDDERAVGKRLRRGVLIELGVAVAVVAIASVLVQSTPARNATAGADTSGPYSVTLTNALYQLQVDIEPLATGLNTLHLYAYTPTGAPIKVLEWHATAALPAQGIEPVDIPLVVLTDNHVSGQVAMLNAGAWTLRFTLRTSELDQASVSQQVPVH